MPIRNTLEFRNLVACVLDEAIATVAEEEFNRLRRITNDDAQVAENIKAALYSLIKLGKGVEPEYNEWVSLFYLTWHQPRQVNLALDILKKPYEDTRSRLGLDFPLQIIDVGCGALAVQFAVAMLAAEYQIEMKNVTVTGIDPSDEMRNIGENLWRAFCSGVDKCPNLSDMSRICNAMTANCSNANTDNAFSKYNATGECWLLAMHAVYETNRQEIKETLETIRYRHNPGIVLLTCKNSRPIRKIARFVVGEEFECEPRSRVKEFWFQGTLPRTTEWRKSLLSLLTKNTLSDVRGLLNNSVKWAGRDKTALFYQKL